MSPNSPSSKPEVPDTHPASRSGSREYGAAITEQRSRSGSAAMAGSVVELRAQEVRTKWKVRVHWGIIFAVVASLALWLLIRTLVGFAF
jgi:ABC-type uncharacterized transport system permease subunit